MLADLKIMRTFAPAIERESIGRKIIGIIGALVQLVRIHACHAWGHGFESRTHRFLRKGKSSVNIELQSFFLSLPPAHTEHIKRYFLFIHKFMMPY